MTMGTNKDHRPRQLDSDSDICPDHDEQNPLGISPQSPDMSALRTHPTTNAYIYRSQITWNEPSYL